MNKKYCIFYVLSFLILILASVYPVYMGVKTLSQYFANGAVESANYPKYIIPYTPICISLLLTAALFPLFYKLAKKYSLIIGSVLGLVIFFSSELFFEQIKVIEGYRTLPIESWQYSLCRATPEVLKAIGEPIYAQNNPAFKVHFYLIASIIVLTVTGLIYGFTQMIKENDKSIIKPLLVQLVCVITFIGLCILACFTAFYRNGTLRIGMLSGILMSLFFIVFGVTAGIYVGSLLYKKSRFLSLTIPTVTAIITVIAMYLGELVLTDGEIFRFGNGFFFEAIGNFPFAPCDIIVILLSGVITAGILVLIKEKPKEVC